MRRWASLLAVVLFVPVLSAREQTAKVATVEGVTEY